ncbi:MAG: hypothetical protein AUK48_00210 [Oscillatoriales cyanobacterium CG2_30_44_21]|nr:MAG: hypothetical protein AUK48_00210 [Oscillatoriales cyanobacterium CG2_30_44_21]
MCDLKFNEFAPTVIVLSPIGQNLHFAAPTYCGYANSGFKAIRSNIPKYGDRYLYISSAKKLTKSQPQPIFSLVQSFSLQKAGNDITECEDAWDYAEHDAMFVIAMSDGATESSFAKEWASEMVTTFVKDQSAFSHETRWLSDLQTRWQSWLSEQKLPWFAKRKAQQGAYATFLSLQVRADLSWQAIAVGDSCLFVVRDRCLQQSFPVQHSNEFGNSPNLVGTSSNLRKGSILKVLGKARGGDRFYLATDAIACWIMKQLEANQNPWVKLEQLDVSDKFAAWINELRDRREIVNDDTTLLCLEINYPEIQATTL